MGRGSSGWEVAHHVLQWQDSQVCVHTHRYRWEITSLYRQKLHNTFSQDNVIHSRAAASVLLHKISTDCRSLVFWQCSEPKTHCSYTYNRRKYAWRVKMRFGSRLWVYSASLYTARQLDYSILNFYNSIINRIMIQYINDRSIYLGQTTMITKFLLLIANNPCF